MLQLAIALPPKKPGFLPDRRVTTKYFPEKTRFLATGSDDRTPTQETWFFTESGGCNDIFS
jgi:hypothetical protein